ncbi:MAG: lipoate--protein ligase [Clostridia bacterium]|nr:lipoate--protein ligase [Clostridia bacterium]
MSEFSFIYHDCHDPYFNIASEEYLLKEKGGCYIYVWKNSPAVIVGVNQNTIAEVNMGETERLNVKIVRRLTGGGAVYHDLNNLCFTVIAENKENSDFYREFTAPVIDYLNSIGVKAEFSGRNDITVDGKKISGNAETFYKDKVLHHGTILFKTDMETLSAVLKPNRYKTESKGIKSVRARVANVSEYTDISAEKFESGLIAFLGKDLPRYEFTAGDIKRINELVREKYSTFAWNIGTSPKGANSFCDKFPFGVFELYFDVEKGLISHAEIRGDFFSYKDSEEFSQKLAGIPFSRSALSSAFADVSEYIAGADGEEIVRRLFS